jgi:hypothetical protein
MNAQRLFFTLLAGFSLVVIAICVSTYTVTTMLGSRASQLGTAKAQVDQLTSQQNSIAKSKKDIASYSELETIAKTIVPQDKDQAEAVRQIVKIAGNSGVTLTTITFPTSSLGDGKTSGSAKLSQLTPVANIPGVYNLQITLGNNLSNPVTFNQLNNFLRGLENNRRTAIVGSINIQPQQDNPNRIVFTLVINTYIKPS